MKIRTAILSAPTLAILAILASLALIPAPALAQSVEQVGENGSIDWTAMTVSATGLGAPPATAQNQAQARALARRAAIVVARRNLLEVVKGVRIDSATYVENFMVRDDRIVSTVEGILQGSEVADVRYMTDGSAEAVVRMPLTGQLGQVLLRLGKNPPSPAPLTLPKQPAPEQKSVSDQLLAGLENRLSALEKRMAEYQQALAAQNQTLAELARKIDAAPKPAPPADADAQGIEAVEKRLDDQDARIAALLASLAGMEARIEALGETPAQPARAARTEQPRAAPPADLPSYTGLVVDATGLGFKPCLKPMLYDKEVVIYPADYVNADVAVAGGYVRYFRKIDQAQRSDSAGALPLTVRALSTHAGPSGLALPEKEGTLLRAYLGAKDNFLAHCRVAIVF